MRVITITTMRKTLLCWQNWALARIDFPSSGRASSRRKASSREPAWITIGAYADESDWNVTSYVMEYHQRSDEGNVKIVKYLTDHFRVPRDFPSMVYLTQVLQAEAVRTGVEYWRRSRRRTGGTLYWQLNDCWPVASWSSLDRKWEEVGIELRGQQAELTGGCVYYERCPVADKGCARDRPALLEAERDHFVACFCYAEKE